MKTNVIFNKERKQIIEGEVIGTIYVYFSHKGQSKPVTTSLKIIRIHFDKYFNKEFQRFIKTTVIDYKALNVAIETVIKTKNPFTITSSAGYVSFFRSELNYIRNQNTKTTYTYIINSFTDFLKNHDLVEIPFNRLTFELFRDYKKHLEDQEISQGSIRYYFIVHKSMMNKANDADLSTINLSLKKFKLSRNVKKSTILQDEDIQTLRNVPKTHHLYNYIQFALLQLFANGLRFSDCLLIKLSDFKPNYLQIQQQKTKQILQIPYSVMFVDTLYKILDYSYSPKFTYNPLVNQMILDGNVEFVTAPKRDAIISHIRAQKEDKFLFSFVDPILMSYVKSTNMTPAQNDRYILHRVNYNNHLGKLRKSLKLSVDTFTSHSMRYAYTRIALELKVDIYTISRSLGHSNIGITENYIRSNFQADNMKEVGDMFANKFKPQSPEA